MPEDALTPVIRAVDRRGKSAWQFVRDIGIHPVIRGPRLLSRIDIETGALAEVVLVRGIGDIVAARAGIRADDDDAVLGSPGLEPRLRCRVLPRAG